MLQYGKFATSLLVSVMAIPVTFLQGTALAVSGDHYAKSVPPGIAALTTNGGHCGGTLIAPQWVLTAAHCVAKAKADPNQTVTVHLGSLNQTEGESFEAPTSNIYIKDGKDMALLKLPQAASSQPASLAGDKEYPPPGATAYVYGWGGTHSSLYLRWAEVSVSKDWCTDVMGDGYGIGTNAVNGHAEPGDSGGPLYKADVATVIGVVSNGIEATGWDCYSSVGNARQWIRDTAGV
ncbi:S1 family peptidase [Streptomyces netropsis]|uniref:S1 family peptidase n=1 Tax=Streptomyces netropsis TaxID=55404 RepID=UPI003797A232